MSRLTRMVGLAVAFGILLGALLFGQRPVANAGDPQPTPTPTPSSGTTPNGGGGGGGLPGH